MISIDKLNSIVKKFGLILVILVMSFSVHAQNEGSVKDAQGLKAGIPAPMFTAIDAESNPFVLKEAIKKGPVVLIFYRGFWCPVCNKHLASIQDSLKMIQEKGAMVIAVSPEKPEYLEEMADNTGARFTLLYDEDYKISDAYDVTFEPSSLQLFTYNNFLGAKLKETHSDESQRLPIPATYIIDQTGTIIWSHFNPDYKQRATVKDILKALPSDKEKLNAKN